MHMHNRLHETDGYGAIYANLTCASQPATSREILHLMGSDIRGL